MFLLHYPCAGVLNLFAWTSVCFCFVYSDVAIPCKHELVTIGVDLSCVFFLWIHLIYAVAWVRYVCVCFCTEKVIPIQNRIN